MDSFQDFITAPETKLTSRINREWHNEHKMPENPSFQQRIDWHLEHQKNCACRPIPEKLLELMRKKEIEI